MNLTRFGVWTTYHAIGVENSAQAARLAQDLGYGAFWLGGSPEVDELRPLLEATETLVAATGIVNVWKSDPATVAAEAAAIVLDDAPAPLPLFPRALTALCPKMLDLAGERSLGSHPACTNGEPTSFARDR